MAKEPVEVLLKKMTDSCLTTAASCTFSSAAVCQAYSITVETKYLRLMATAKTSLVNGDCCLMPFGFCSAVYATQMIQSISDRKQHNEVIQNPVASTNKAGLSQGWHTKLIGPKSLDQCKGSC